MLKHPERTALRSPEDDPFGESFLESLAAVDEPLRRCRLDSIAAILRTAVPGFGKLEFVRDREGRPRLRMLCVHHSTENGWQNEESFSDGTLRLTGLLWSLQEEASLLLLEEPELSLDEGIVERLPELMDRVRPEGGKRSQIVIGTHSEALLSNPGIDGRGVIVLEVGEHGSTGRSLNTEEREALDAGFSAAEAVLSKIRPRSLYSINNLRELHDASSARSLCCVLAPKRAVKSRSATKTAMK